MKKEEFLSFLKQERGLSTQTQREYGIDLDTWSRWLKENGLEGQEVGPKVVQGYVRTLREKGLAPATVARKVSSCSTYHKWAKREGHIKENPVYFIELPKRPKRLPIYLSDDERMRFLSRLNSEAEESPYMGTRNRAMFALMLFTGLRITETRTLQATNIIMQAGQPYRVRVVGKGDKEREVRLHPEAVAALSRWLAVREAMKDPETSRKVTRRSPKELYSNYLFPGPIGEPMSAKGIQEIMRRLAKEVSPGKRLTPHKLRHSCATWLHRRGAPLVAIQKVLGHENISTTTIYTHLEDKELDAIFEG
ncbi:MAG: tyrosine-type recombinase/integrase [Fibrobacteres bacterium]|nr:tyrosine-type recombinase/integrase [Fibrobacterota bacterium]